ncbi:hypothetical protein L195_g032464 [Trifolium pratense]|uniref:Uncharacterized protein n=1 Tax=Trifolium pratense TaxID=57577 RepID=A0A2K3LD94_TRIPR|nr:hypothetical protein L195_g032464 [Trifolium pratense]
MPYKDACIVINGGNHNEVVSDKIQWVLGIAMLLNIVKFRTVTEVESMLLGKGKVDG